MGSCPYSWKCQFAHGPGELRSRKVPQTKTAGAGEKATGKEEDKSKALPHQQTCELLDAKLAEVCSLCEHIDAKASSAPEASTVSASPPTSREASHATLVAPAALLAEPQLWRTAKAFSPLDFAQSGAAGCFASSRGLSVPADVRSLWAEDPGECSPLRCNRRTGKIEPAEYGMPAIPWVNKRMSSTGELVRRTISFVLEGSI